MDEHGLITDLIVASVAVALFAIAVAGALAYRLTSRVRRRTARRACRIALLVALAACAPALSAAIQSTIRTGDWVCVTCGHAEERASLMGISFRAQRASTERGVAESVDAYRALLEAPSERGGRHAWMPVGCHYQGDSTVACTCIGPAKWFAVLPTLADRALARCLAQKLAASSARERSAIVCEFDMNFARAPVSNDAFEAWYERWRSDHSGWPARTR